MRAAVAFAAVLMLGSAFFALVGLQWKHELGAFADSPQRVEVPGGSRRIVAGGRAILGVISIDQEMIKVEVGCAAEQQRMELALGDTADPVCGVAVTAEGFLGTPGDDENPLRLVAMVAWSSEQLSTSLDQLDG